MKGFKKLALASAIATLPVSGFAMEALDDATLSDVTGQSGVTITIGSVAFDAIRVDDADGLDGTATAGTAQGSIWIRNFSMPGATTVAVDADANTLQANISLAAGTIQLGSISPQAFQTTTPNGLADGSEDAIQLGSLTHDGISLNVQLGTEDQTQGMIALSGTAPTGITFNGFAIADGSSGETISMNLGLVDAGGTGLNLSGSINVDATGLVIDGLGNMDVTLGSLTLGSTPAIGDVSILNLDLGPITISGH